MQILALFRGQLEKIEERLGYKFQDLSLLEQSFVHKSFLNEHMELVKGSNERLEFLGDSVLGLIISEFLYQKFPEYTEGALSELRARLVESKALQNYIEKLNISSHLIKGKGESREENKASLVADLFEAIVGAIYLDGGYENVKSFLFNNFQTEFEATMGAPSRNWKTELQDFAQKKYATKPIYRIVHEEGPDHAKIFHVTVSILEVDRGFGVGTSKKQAETNAAEQAISKVMENE